MLEDVLGSMLDVSNLSMIVFGVFIGYVVGVLPGLDRSTAMAIAVPVTFTMSPLASISLIIGIAKGSATGGAVSAILVNTPGEASSAVTCLDGYPMSRKGEGVKALQTAILGSTAGDLLSTITLIVVSAPIAKLALRIGPVELVSILFFALSFIAGLSASSLLKGLISASLGLLVASVGLDPESGTSRLTFGRVELLDGVPLSVIAIGLLAMGEMLTQAGQSLGSAAGADGQSALLNRSDGEPLRWADVKRICPTILRSSLVGIGVGMVPGLGAAIGSFLAYGVAKKKSRHPEEFGKGAIEGVAASETADNAVIPASFIPLFTLGIPGSAAAAILIGAFMIHGVTPGPELFDKHASLMFGVYSSMMIASVTMFLMGWFGLRIFALLTKVPEVIVVPTVVLLCVIGSFLGNHSFFDVALMIGFGVVGYLLRLLDFPFITFLVAFVVGPSFELALRQSILITDGDVGELVYHPVALIFLVLSLLSLIGAARGKLRGSR